MAGTGVEGLEGARCGWLVPRTTIDADHGWLETSFLCSMTCLSPGRPSFIVHRTRFTSVALHPFYFTTVTPLQVLIAP